MISVVVGALRWRVLLLALGMQVKTRDVIRLGFIGDFFSVAAPGMVGGDLVKAYYVSKESRRYGTALLSVFMDRIIGLCAMAVLAGAILLFLWLRGGWDAGVMASPGLTIAVVLTGILALVVFVRTKALHTMALVQAAMHWLKRFRILHELGTAMLALNQRPAAVGRAFVLCVLSHGLQICGVWLLGRGLGLTVPVMNYFLCVPLILILSAVPLTPGSIGLTEKLFLYYFAGLAPPGALLGLALLNRVVALLSALVGAILVAGGPAMPRLQEVRARGERQMAHEHQENER